MLVVSVIELANLLFVKFDNFEVKLVFDLTFDSLLGVVHHEGCHFDSVILVLEVKHAELLQVSCALFVSCAPHNEQLVRRDSTWQQADEVKEGKRVGKSRRQ